MTSANNMLNGLLAKVKSTGEIGVICYAIWSPEDETAQLFSMSVRFTGEDGKTRQDEYRAHALEVIAPSIVKLAEDLAAAIKVLRHCKLFLADRKGYLTDADMERESIVRKLSEVIQRLSQLYLTSVL